ncbi:MAG: SlyX family protein [Porticoccus sp.]|nr:SlyX family protein [Porticoccus sp.]MBQ0808145.1 SlyX family protein [Porticoccus sp.]
MDDDRLVEVETKLAYQEDTIQQLNDVICRQQDQIDALLVKYGLLVTRVKELDNDLPEGDGVDERPPHY